MKPAVFHRCRILLAPVLLSLSLAGYAQLPAAPAAGQSFRADGRRIADRLRAETIREVTVQLTAPDMEGRGTGQPGGVKAAKYLAERFAHLGLRPLGDDGTYLQAIPFQTVRVRPDSSLKVGDQDLKPAAVYVYQRPRHPEREIVEVRGDLICVDMATVRGKPREAGTAELKGKIAVAVSGSPDAMAIARRGASGIIVALDGPDVPPHFADGGPHSDVTLANPLRGMKGNLTPVAYVNRAGAERLFAQSPQSYADTRAKARAGQSFHRELGQQAEMSLRLTIEPLASHNVVGLLEGSDPRLKEEAIVYSAHYDAYGKGTDGQIRPGAADNALGVGKMLAVAEALARSADRPRRSVIFLATTAEELGLLGARYWLEHPTWSLAKIAANLNLDGIDTDTYGPLRALVIEGLGHSDLDATATAVAVDLGLLPVPDLDTKSRVFFRSDHYEFALRGIPPVYAFGLGVPPARDESKSEPGAVLGALAGAASLVRGLAEVQARADEFLAKRYHQPSDDVRPEWDWQGVRSAAVFYLIVGLRVANTEELPQWLPKSEFNRPRGMPHPQRQD